MESYAPIITTILLFALAGLAIYIRLSTSEKKITNINEFIKEYHDNILAIIRDAITVLKIDMRNYESKEEYEEAIIEVSVKALYNNPSLYGIPEELTSVISEDVAISMIKKFFADNKIKSFSGLQTSEIQNNKGIIDNQVIKARGIE